LAEWESSIKPAFFKRQLRFSYTSITARTKTLRTNCEKTDKVVKVSETGDVVQNYFTGNSQSAT